MARPATRVLTFPMRLGALSDEMLRKAAPSPPISVSGQYELFPPDPAPPKPWDPSELIIRYTALQIDVVKLMPHATNDERFRFYTDWEYVMVGIRAAQDRIARWRESEAEAWHSRIA